MAMLFSCCCAYLIMKQGQKVVCIKGSDILIEGEIYTILEIIVNGKGVTLKEVSPHKDEVGFHIWRFRTIDTKWVDDYLQKIIEDEIILV